ncbi:uncharacterized protein A4U43_C04F11980 [Asparagus officinalis]|uniref:Uncharacterized protein n=1 Tax=Asparagus officinalis TaxID=4686 RepID=A0A5P1F5J6_ASPOF|nr:uncharacterized protein A4U43_C04F11980 [Asparagus officinalis]
MSTPKREWVEGRPQRENRLSPRLEGGREGEGVSPPISKKKSFNIFSNCTAMADNNKKLPVKLMVDKEKNRVAFAESHHKFVDILFSFLTVPVATIIRISGKNSSSSGSFANI